MQQNLVMNSIILHYPPLDNISGCWLVNALYVQNPCTRLVVTLHYGVFTSLCKDGIKLNLNMLCIPHRDGRTNFLKKRMKNVQINTEKKHCSKLHYYERFNVPTRGRRGRDRMVVGFTNTYTMSAYHHWCCEFESHLGRGVHHYVI